MGQQFKTYSALVAVMNNSINIAVQNACNRLLGKLQELIDTEFYDVFEPNYYKRTYQFWQSATTKMLNQNCGEIFMDASKMNYNSFWTGEKQLQAASIGSHGGYVTDETKQHRFWEEFIKYCDSHAVDILREELKKQGIITK